MDTFTNDGLTFDVVDSGAISGDAIVLLHGFPESNASWREVTPHLVAAGYRVLAPNQRGYAAGARPRSRRAYTLDKLSGDVLALADAAGVHKFHVVGHDWGGMVTWALAANHPERIKTATSLTTPHPKAMARSMVRSTQALKSLYAVFFQMPVVPELGFRSPASAAMRRQLTRSGMPEEYVDEYVARMAEPGAARGALNWYRAVPLSPPTRIGNVSVPTMYIYADDDVALGGVAADLTGDFVTGPYRYEVLPGVSHWVPEEVPETVVELLLDFIGTAP
jgi:pimeloyl-ACP methyl ester carboxylesterase